LPPLEPDGTSHLWDALGRKFTDLTYAEADRLSKKNKEFIKGLFPEGAIYASLLPQTAQDVIGKVGAQTRGVERLLRRIGFRYAWRVDPFDGGPHFTAPTDEVTLVRASHKAKVAKVAPPGHGIKSRALVGIDPSGPPFFRAVLAPWRKVAVTSATPRADEPVSGEMGADAAALLDVHEGDEVAVLPLE
jgi:arginine N-succinyltransferase